MGSIGNAASVKTGGLSPFTGKTLTRRVDDIANSDPGRTWVTVPLTNDVYGEWKDITFGELRQAIDGLARWIESKIGAGKDRETVAYLGINDIRYTVVILAMMKTNRKALLPSLRNSDDGQANLVAGTGTKEYFYSEGVEKHLNAFTFNSQLRGFQIPSFEEMLTEGAKGLYPTREEEKKFPEKEFEKVLVLHTSGSTGLPKPIYVTNGWLSTLEHQKYMPAPPGRRNAIATQMSDDKNMFTMLPFFHTMGIMTIVRSIYSGPLLLPPPGRMPNAELATDILLHKKPWSGLFTPSMLEDMSESERSLEALATTEYIFFAGSPLAKEAGDRIIKKTNLVSIIGSTEACFTATLHHEDPTSDWQYFDWSPHSGIVMEDAGQGEGLHECVIKRISHPSYLGVFYSFPEIEEWRTKDLFEAHPTKPGLWKYKGRRDDVLVLSNGEKFNPVTYEKTVEEHPDIRGALVVGQGRFQPALLIEPDWDRVGARDLTAFLDSIWSVVEKANNDAPSHAQVWKNKIAFTKKEKPFSRAAKGSIQRRMTVSTYDKEIDALYLNEGQGFEEKLGKFDKNSDLPATMEFLRNAFKLVLTSLQGSSELAETLEDDTDIFDLGVDSLQVMALSSALSSALKSGNEKGSRDAAVMPRDIYRNPTVEKLAAALLKKISGAGGNEVSREQKMAEVLKKFTANLPEATSVPCAAPLPQKHTYILTGTTGALGNFILQDLIASPDVAKVFCLNRSRDAEARQAKSFAERDVTPDFSKVTFLHTDFSKPDFGLPQEVYDELARKTTAFIHNAWAVDFNQALDSYEPTHLAGVRHVVDFSLRSAHRAQILFISSIASIGNYPSTVSEKGPLPERYFEDDRVPLPQGYGESKHVAGRILAAAAEKSGVPSSIIRCGQLGGPRSKGVWNRHEWLPSLVHSSKNMGMVPSTLSSSDRSVDWVPMDAAGRTVVQLSRRRLQLLQQQQQQQDAAASDAPHRQLLDVFHVSNPHVVCWRDLAPTVVAFYEKQQGREIRAVAFDEWLAALKAVPLTPDEIAAKPGVKLVDFYNGLRVEGGALPEMDNAHAREYSECLRELQPVDAALMEHWLRSWEF
ncbi:uncharacterized protein IWZ02DRAFT_406008 [Phyllosticta citriasiana]|uniref:uncharacterized protein n=1 Tax=Phyllosticta citriasiana TaxID=595635 RepID=UPI0030FD6DBB